MFIRQKLSSVRFGRGIVLILLTGCLAFFCEGCSVKTLNPSVSGPQVIVNPETLRLGVSKLMDTDIVFEGSGFQPGDSIFITLIGPQQVKAIVAEAPIQADGTFRASVSKLTKAMEILKADIAMNEKFDSVMVITQDPIPAGEYTAKVTSMLSNRTAETKLTLAEPSAIDRLKDWIGKLLGKIRYKK